MYIFFSSFMSYTYIKAWKTSSSSFLENQKRGEEEKNRQMWRSLVCCTFFVLCFLPHVACLWRGQSIPYAVKSPMQWSPPCSKGVLTSCWGTVPGWKLPWSSARVLMDISFLCRGGHLRSHTLIPPSPRWWLARPRSTGEGGGKLPSLWTGCWGLG